tara:strand:- start:84 stop:638 length:555 start_codon:yes stop_codon:yes gene_type:complete
MKVVLFFTLIILLSTCSSNKSVYWCGDHACINKKEKEAYFKKTMIIEKKIINERNKKDLTKSQEIIEKARANEKKEIANEKNTKREEKLKQKKLKKEQKELAKQAKLEKKKLKKKEKQLAKEVKNEKKNIKKKLSKSKKTKDIKVKKTASFSLSLNNGEFEQIKDQIIKKNLIRSYPDINDIPN